MYSFIIFETDLTALLRLALAFWAQTSSCMILISRWDLQACAFPSPHLDDGFCLSDLGVLTCLRACHSFFLLGSWH